MVEYVPYNDGKHRAQFLELNMEYMYWGIDQFLENYGSTPIPRDSVREFVENSLPKFIDMKPQEGIIYILEVDGAVAGMGALRKLEKGVGEIKRMYIRPEYQGRGFGKEMLDRLTDKALELGFSMLRLDTSDCFRAAKHVYQSAGFKMRGPYPGIEVSGMGPHQIFMEKEL
ncbi:MAG: GNAT family N-acetyltransferase [Candidatus Bathyarchaeota archaeon]|nr:GNAT family N-acetyltransferase [Candidatus Bathyarchaeota archaeon]